MQSKYHLMVHKYSIFITAKLYCLHALGDAK